MRGARPVLLAAALALGGCGGDEGSKPPPKPPPEGASIADLIVEMRSPDSAVASRAVVALTMRGRDDPEVVRRLADTLQSSQLEGGAERLRLVLDKAGLDDDEVRAQAEARVSEVVVARLTSLGETGIVVDSRGGGLVVVSIPRAGGGVDEEARLAELGAYLVRPGVVTLAARVPRAGGTPELREAASLPPGSVGLSFRAATPRAGPALLVRPVPESREAFAAWNDSLDGGEAALLVDGSVEATWNTDRTTRDGATVPLGAGADGMLRAKRLEALSTSGPMRHPAKPEVLPPYSSQQDPPAARVLVQIGEAAFPTLEEIVKAGGPGAAAARWAKDRILYEKAHPKPPR